VGRTLGSSPNGAERWCQLLSALAVHAGKYVRTRVLVLVPRTPLKYKVIGHHSPPVTEQVLRSFSALPTLLFSTACTLAISVHAANCKLQLPVPIHPSADLPNNMPPHRSVLRSCSTYDVLPSGTILQLIRRVVAELTRM
jgi:hypothetical protein